MTSKSCNLNCSYCFWKKIQYISEYVDIKEEINNNEKYFFCIGTNEPFLNLDYLEKIILLAKNKNNVNKKVFVYTNGTIDNDKVYNLLCKYKNNISLIVSLDGPEKYHNLYRVDYNKNGTYTKVIDFINKYNFIIDEIAVTVCPSYNLIQCLKHIVDICIKNKILSILVVPVISTSFFSKFHWTKRNLIKYYQILDEFEQYLDNIYPNIELRRSCGNNYNEEIILNNHKRIKVYNIFS